MLVLSRRHSSKHQVTDVERSTTNLSVMVASQNLLVFGKADDDYVTCLIGSVNRELCVYCCMLIIVGLGPW
jgi:hypothetical protein